MSPKFSELKTSELFDYLDALQAKVKENADQIKALEALQASFMETLEESKAEIEV